MTNHAAANDDGQLFRNWHAETRANDPRVKALAGRIHQTQDAEVNLMAGWLSGWGEAVPAPDQAHTAHGPGMMNHADMEDLKASSGAAFDRAGIGALVWRDGDRVVVNAGRPRIAAVDDLAWPAWHLFDPRTYYDHGLMCGIDFGFSIPILATRGCPYSCTYCASPGMWGTRWIARDPAKVVDEIEHYVATYGARR